MKRSASSPEIARFNRAAFHVGAEAFRQGQLELLLEARVVHL